MSLFLKHWTPVFLWAFGIFYLSAMPNLSSGLQTDFFLRKLAHIFEYFILAVFIYNALLNTFSKKQPGSLRIVFLVLFIAFLYAVSDEYHQTFVFGRDGNIKDVLIDFLGAMLGACAFYKFKFGSRSKDK